MFVGPAAHAEEPTAADIESARAAYVEGKLLREQGNHAGALEKFYAAYALAPTPITALELGRELQAADKLVEAREILLAVDRMKPRPNESAKAATARTDAHQLAERLRVVIPTITLQLVHPPGLAPQVTIDGDRLPSAALTTARHLNPGSHEIVAVAPGYEGRRSITLKEGAHESVTVELQATPGAAPGPAPAAALAPTPLAPGAPAAEPSSSGSVLIPLGLALAATGAVIGGITGGLAWSAAGTLQDRCAGGRCPPDVHGDLSYANEMSTTSTIAFSAAAVGLVVAGVGWFLSRRPSPPPAAAGGPR